MPSANRQSAYYAQQAAQCAAAASTTTSPEVKQAYLDLEQGWRHLFPEVADRPGAPSVDPPTIRDNRK